jgi:hypothetical protein
VRNASLVEEASAAAASLLDQAQQQALSCDPVLGADVLFGDEHAPVLRLTIGGDCVDLRYEPRTLAVHFSAAMDSKLGPIAAPRMVELEGTGLHVVVRTGVDPASGRPAAFFNVTVFLLANNARLCRDVASRLAMIARETRGRGAAQVFV